MKSIEINNLSFSFNQPGNQNPFVLDIPNFTISDGEFISILGPNGCGKSTLLKIICNLLNPDKTDLKIFETPIQKLSLKEFSKMVAFVPQNNYSVFPFSVYEIVMMGRTPYLNMMGFENKDDREIVNDSMKKMQIQHLAKKGIGELSGGEAQRVFIARALAQQTKIILLDEPGTHMDIEHQIMIYEMLKKINSDEGKTILTVSHDLNFVGIYFDRIIILKAGKILYDGKKSVVLTKEKIKEVFNVDVAIYPGASSTLNVLVNPVNNF